MVLTLTLLGLVAIVILTAISGFFSSSELAVFSVPGHRIDTLEAANVPGAAALAALRDDPHRFLVTALVSNNVANIAAASVATAILVQFLPAGSAATISTAGTSFFVIVFGEIAPKSYAVTNAEKHALRVSRPIRVIQRLLRPVLLVFEVATGAINRLTGGSSNIETYVTREEIATIVTSGEVSGVLDTGESAMIRSVLDLEATSVQTVMVPRSAMVTASVDTTPEEVIETCWRERVTRVPLYGENRDDIRGFVDLRDVLRARSEGESITDVLTEMPFVPASKPVDELLTEMQLDGHRMAIVVDEYGTVVGLITIEDLVEEVVGEIFDRDETDPVRVVDKDTALVNGWATVDYVNEQLGLDIQTDGPFETVAGLVNHHTGQLAEEGDRVELGTVVITVVDATARRVRRVRIDWTPDEPDDVPVE
ncbi:hemolysin family protein [Halovenus marina]|uniref:hemolysin family protein n=1 Tax=Halovenus marina TaxID=3396621 RepID=UPI003F5461F4